MVGLQSGVATGRIYWVTVLVCLDSLCVICHELQFLESKVFVVISYSMFMVTRPGYSGWRRREVLV